MNADQVQPVDNTERRLRGKGRGSKFMVLGRQNYEQLRSAPTTNRMNLILTFLTLLAGTGADHKHSGWSLNACEQHLGIGKPRAKQAISELMSAGLVSLGANYSLRKPQYELRPPSDSVEEIFLPNQIVTGFGDEVSVLRRLRETQNLDALNILIAIYAIAELDGTYGLPISVCARRSITGEAQCLLQRGAYTLWCVPWPNQWQASSDWLKASVRTQAVTEDARDRFWKAHSALLSIGAISEELWLFDSNDNSAEPVFPVDRDGLFAGEESPSIAVTEALYRMVREFVGDEEYLLDRGDEGLLVVLPSHCAAPAIQGVLTPTVTPDSPGHRMNYGRKMQIVEHLLGVFDAAASWFQDGNFGTPFGLAPPKVGGANARRVQV